MSERIASWVLAVLLALGAAPAFANVSPTQDLLRAEDAAYRVLGQGKMRWFGLLLYEAALWVPATDWSWNRPFALDIRYARDITGKRLAEVSVDEFRRLALGDDGKHRAWYEQMRRVFPDVRKGDRITGVYRPGSGAEFFHNGRSMGVVPDTEFARCFFSIWLDERTREPALRAALLGRS